MKNRVYKVQTIGQLHEIAGFEKPKHPLVTVIDFSKVKVNDTPESGSFICSFYSVNFKKHCNFVYGRQVFDHKEGCLIFLFFESAFGICLGCKFYPFFFKEKAQYCPGEVCDIKNKQDIQKTSKTQLLILLAFIAFTFLIVNSFNDNFSEKPYDLFGENNIEQSK